MVEVNKYEWDQTSKIETRDNKVYYRSLKVIGNAGSIVIRTGSHVTIEDEGRDRNFRSSDYDLSRTNYTVKK